MSVYHWLVVLVVLFGFLMHGERKRNIKYILVAVILMFCVYGLRDAYSIGNDSSSSYLHQFERTENTDWDDMPDISNWWSGEETEAKDNFGNERNFGLPWLMKIIFDQTDGEYQWVVSIIAAFVMIAIAYVIYRFSPSPLQSVLYYFGLLYFTFHFNALKQSVAMGFVLFSLGAIADRKPLRFLILVIIASFFHYPAIAFLPAYWIANMRIGRSYLFFLAALFVLTYIFRDQMLDLMTDTYDTGINENSGMRFLANKVIVMVIIIVAAMIIRPPDPEDRMYCMLLQLMGVAAVIQTFAGYNNTFERLADYYFQFAIVFIPMVFEEVNTKRRHLSERELRLVRRVGPYVFCAFAVWRFLGNIVYDPTIYPYQFYFQAEKAEETLSTYSHFMS